MRVLACFVVLMNCLSTGYASTPANLPSDPAPVATLDLSSQLLPGHANLHLASFAFVSETSIALVLCSKGKPDPCQLSVIRWEGGVLRPSPQTVGWDTGAHVNPATDGRVLGTCYSLLCNPVLYSADLSTSLRLPSPLFVVSPSGSTVATITIGGSKPTTKGWKPTGGGWKVYHLGSNLEPIRDGTGNLRSISDEVVVIQDDTTLRTETLAGKVLGSFSVPPENKCDTEVEPLDDHRLFLSNCKGMRVVDFNGHQQLKLQKPKGWWYMSGRFSVNEFPWSANGSRLLANYVYRKVSALRNSVEIAVALVSMLEVDLMQDWNRQEIRVVDTVTGASCFDWRQSFPLHSNPLVAASISPSGEFLALASANALSIYSLPAVCETKK